MGYLTGFREYLEKEYALTVFDGAVASEGFWEMHLHGHKVITARVLENFKYDVKVETKGREIEIVPKISIKLLYSAELSASVRALIKNNGAVAVLALAPLLAPGHRFHIKNKTLFPLMADRQVMFFTLLEGEMVRGVINGFNRYEVTVHMKGGLPVIIMRHSIYDLRDKKDVCFLKSAQIDRKDWEQSPLYRAEAE